MRHDLIRFRFLFSLYLFLFFNCDVTLFQSQQAGNWRTIGYLCEALFFLFQLISVHLWDIFSFRPLNIFHIGWYCSFYLFGPRYIGFAAFDIHVLQFWRQDMDGVGIVHLEIISLFAFCVILEMA